MLAEFWQVVRKDLFVELHDFPDQNIVKVVERQNRVFGHQVTKSNESHQFILGVY